MCANRSNWLSLTRLREEPGSSTRVVTLSPATTLNASIVMHSSGRTDQAARALTFSRRRATEAASEGREAEGPVTSAAAGLDPVANDGLAGARPLENRE